MLQPQLARENPRLAVGPGVRVRRGDRWAHGVAAGYDGAARAGFDAGGRTDN
jgi:hypothetical protein